MTIPLKQHIVTYAFGRRYPFTWFFIKRGLAGRRHKGVDLVSKKNKEVQAPLAFKQTFAGFKKGYGNTIEGFTLDGRYFFRFAHLDAIGIARVNKKWEEGEVFAWYGSTGYSTAPHLHWEVYELGKRIDPLELLTRKAIKPIDKDVVKFYFGKIWRRRPAKGEWMYFLTRVQKNGLDRTKLKRIMAYWYGIAMKDDKRWQREKRKVLK